LTKLISNYISLLTVQHAIRDTGRLQLQPFVTRRYVRGTGLGVD